MRERVIVLRSSLERGAAALPNSRDHDVAGQLSNRSRARHQASVSGCMCAVAVELDVCDSRSTQAPVFRKTPSRNRELSQASARRRLRSARGATDIRHPDFAKHFALLWSDGRASRRHRQPTLRCRPARFAHSGRKVAPIARPTGVWCELPGYAPRWRRRSAHRLGRPCGARGCVRNRATRPRQASPRLEDS